MWENMPPLNPQEGVFNARGSGGHTLTWIHMECIEALIRRLVPTGRWAARVRGCGPSVCAGGIDICRSHFRKVLLFGVHSEDHPPVRHTADRHDGRPYVQGYVCSAVVSTTQEAAAEISRQEKLDAGSDKKLSTEPCREQTLIGDASGL